MQHLCLAPKLQGAVYKSLSIATAQPSQLECAGVWLIGVDPPQSTTPLLLRLSSYCQI